MVDLNTYTPPGVYVQDISQDIVVPLSVGVPENLLCIVAPAQGYQTVVENVAVFSVLGTALRNNGVINDETLVVRTMTGTLLVKDVSGGLVGDYWITPGTSTTPTIINRLPADAGTPSPAGVTDGQLVAVTYNFTAANYYIPQRFSDYNTLAAVYGTALAAPGSTDPVNSPMSLAAKIAFENGAGSIIALPVQRHPDPAFPNSTWQQDFASAYAQLVTLHLVSVLVVIIPDAEVALGSTLVDYLTDIRIHCDSAAANGFGRTALTGAGTSYDETDAPYEDAAATVANKRVVLVYPFRLNLTNIQTSTVVELGAGYAAAALGGRLVMNNVEKSLTREVVYSFDSIPASIQQEMTLAFKNHLSASGVCVIETDRLNRLVVRHGLTTDMAALNRREISLVRISDVLSQNIQVGLDTSGLIGEPIDAEMTMKVKGALQGLLEQAIASHIIVGYINLLVRQQISPFGDPSIIDCTFAYQPAVPLNHVTVEFSLNLTTGVVDTTAV